VTPPNQRFFARGVRMRCGNLGRASLVGAAVVVGASSGSGASPHRGRHSTSLYGFSLVAVALFGAIVGAGVVLAMAYTRE